MTNPFPEGSYFGTLFDENPNMVIIINAQRISVFNGDDMGFYPQPENPLGLLSVSDELNLFADDIKDLM